MQVFPHINTLVETSDNSFLSCKAKQIDRFQRFKNSPQITYTEALHISPLKYQTFFLTPVLTVLPTMNCKGKDSYHTALCQTFIIV